MVAVCAVAGFALVMEVTRGPSPAGAVSSPAASSGSLPAAAGSSPAAGAFSQVPKPCALLSAAIVAKYLPGSTCTAQSADAVANTAEWSPRAISLSDDFVCSIDAVLVAPGTIGPLFDGQKASMPSELTGGTIVDSRPITGLGDQAYVIFGTNTLGSSTELIVADENAFISIDYYGWVRGQEPSQASAEAAVQAMARDVIKNLH